MFLVLFSVIIFCFCGLASLVAGRDAKAANLVGAGGAVVGATVGIIPSIGILSTGRAEEIRHLWNVPYGSIFLQIDALSAFYLSSCWLH